MVRFHKEKFDEICFVNWNPGFISHSFFGNPHFASSHIWDVLLLIIAGESSNEWYVYVCIDGVAATPICSAAAGSNNPTGLIFFPITLPGVTDSTLTSQVHVWVVQLSVALVVKVAALTVLRR